MRRTILLAVLSFPLAAQIDPRVHVNNVDGSDTQASGAPSAYGPRSAVATCHTNGAASTVIQWASNPLSDVPLDGSSALWLDVPTGFQLSDITSRTNDTVTVTGTYNISAAAKVDCAVGGKRRTLNQRLVEELRNSLPPDPGWALVIEYTGTSYTTPTALSATNTGNIYGCGIEGSGIQRPIIESTANITTLNPGICSVKYLHFTNTSVSKTSAYALDLSGWSGTRIARSIEDSIFGGSSASDSFQSCCTPNSGDGILYFIGNESRFNVIGYDGPTDSSFFVSNYIHDNTTGVRTPNYTTQVRDCGTWIRNYVVNNTSVGFQVRCIPTATYELTPSDAVKYLISSGLWIENTVDGNGSHGFDFSGGSGAKTLLNNQITNNAGFGITCSGGGCQYLRDKGFVEYNNFFNNTLGDRNEWPVGLSELSINPKYISRAGKNWCPSEITKSNRGGPPGIGEVFPGTITESLLVAGACQPKAVRFTYAF